MTDDFVHVEAGLRKHLEGLAEQAIVRVPVWKYGASVMGRPDGRVSRKAGTTHSEAGSAGVRAGLGMLGK